MIGHGVWVGDCYVYVLVQEEKEDYRRQSSTHTCTTVLKLLGIPVWRFNHSTITSEKIQLYHYKAATSAHHSEALLPVVLHHTHDL